MQPVFDNFAFNLSKIGGLLCSQCHVIMSSWQAQLNSMFELITDDNEGMMNGGK